MTPVTFAQYLEKWLKQSTAQGLNNPLIRMPVARFRALQATEFASIANGGALVIGTISDPIARNLHKNFQTHIRERGEHCAFVCTGTVAMTIAGGAAPQPRSALFPVCLKRASLQTAGEKIKVVASDEEPWRLNPVLEAHLRGFGIQLSSRAQHSPEENINWLRAQLGNRATSVTADSYVGLFSSQQMVVQERFREPPLRQALARSPVIQAKIQNAKVLPAEMDELPTDDGIEELGLVLPCDDSQLRVVQLSHNCCLQVEGPPGTGKSQTIANIISNALFHGRTALLVCDKKAAITQVEERLSHCGLKPALLNLHDEDLDKREFLKQATAKFPSTSRRRAYPFTELREARTVLNERVKFGRALAHPSLHVTKQEALAGLIQLRKHLKHVPTFPIPGWQTLSSERLAKLLDLIAEWPALGPVVSDSANLWNKVRVEPFSENPNASNEVTNLCEKIRMHTTALDEICEQAASVGIELPLRSDADAKSMLALVDSVLARPSCYPGIVGNPALTLSELKSLQDSWERRHNLAARRHPVDLTILYPPAAESEAKNLLAAESAVSWSDLSIAHEKHGEKLVLIERHQNRYARICEQLGIKYSPLVRVRRAQLRAILDLGKFGGLIPRSWWSAAAHPVLAVNGWIAKLRACITHSAAAPLPLHYVSLERIAGTHWRHVEATAEHGNNLLSYVLHFVHDRKCKFALRQAYPAVPPRAFKHWRELTLHAVAGLGHARDLRTAAEIHTSLRQLTENYLSVAHADPGTDFIEHEEVKRLASAAALVELWRGRNDLFYVDSIHWQTFWESPDSNVLAEVSSLSDELDALPMPENSADNIEGAFVFYHEARQRIEQFLSRYETTEGDRQNGVLSAFAAQKEFAECQQRLSALEKYLVLQGSDQSQPDWKFLHGALAWRDTFERLRANQKLDADSKTWGTLRRALHTHLSSMENYRQQLEHYFEPILSAEADFASISSTVADILAQLPQRHAWLEKQRWQTKISGYPEIAPLWQRLQQGTEPLEHAQQLFCFNLLRLCDPIAKPHGAELKQTLNKFGEQDDNLTMWVLEGLKARLAKSMQDAATKCPESEAELRRLSGLQRVRGTVRELVNAHVDYLLAAKPCWMISPTSLANLIDSAVFEQHGVPFDLVIFDEASQIRVLDGLLSMAFARQVIIVGDKNQLPPTDFFAGFADPAVDPESQDFGTSESLLDEFAGVFEDDKTHVMLMSHYRSETPDLIKFSNDWFYSSRLETYPPARISGTGRRLHYVPDAVYSEAAGQRNNPKEAGDVMRLIEQHVRQFPNKSLGVVTMNIPQMELIDELLQSCLDPAVRSFCADETRFFLRNLETVQGDEMDRIILSLTYGKNSAGHFNASVLGPLTKGGGERRLNVAITRSRSGMIVVTSLKSADLGSSGAQSKGFLCLKSLLQDLESMEQRRDYGISNKRFDRKRDGVANVIYCDAPFEEQVVEFLENEGYEVECQYGAGNFWLDIVVKERGRNLLAIECDGAAYHTSLVARTRDRARQRILEKLGWRIHRVWSANWWLFEQQEKDAIVAAINAARTSAR